MSTTTIPEGLPVVRPMFASGIRDHHERINASSVVASLNPFFVFGCLPGEISDAKVHQCLEMANLSAFTRSLERGLDTRLGDRGTRLSGGERQRVAIARGRDYPCSARC